MSERLYYLLNNRSGIHCFELSTYSISFHHSFQGGYCCGYHATTDVSKGFDCVHLPGAEDENMVAVKSNYCGRGDTSGQANVVTLCCEYE